MGDLSEEEQFAPFFRPIVQVPGGEIHPPRPIESDYPKAPYGVESVIKTSDHTVDRMFWFHPQRNHKLGK